MLQNFPPTYFYIPKHFWPAYIPQNIEENWSGFGLGIYAWTLQTYLRLNADNFPCQLVDTPPTEGIILAHRNALQIHRPPLKPGPNLLLICLKAESLPCPYAQLHIVQNPVESLTLNHSYFLPHWPQPGLIPRNPARGDRIETVAFFGHANNLAPELKHPDWAKQLQEIRLQWRPVINTNRWDNHQTLNTRWNDYSQIDVVVAVRIGEYTESEDPLSAQKLGLSIVQGVADGGIMLWRLLTSSLQKLTKFAFMPHIHHANYAGPVWRQICSQLDIDYIDLSWPMEQVLSAIGRTETLLTEAMHGAIAADSLRTPWIPIVASAQILHFKWRHWRAAVGLACQPQDLKPLASTYPRLARGVRSSIRTFLHWSHSLRQRPLKGVALITPDERQQAVSQLRHIILKTRPILSKEDKLEQLTMALEERLHQLNKDVSRLEGVSY